jgi:5,10-methylenetetrahydromethanopterin reductase
MASAMSGAQRAMKPAGAALRDPWSWRDFVELATTAEETGFSALFLPEIAGREAFSSLAALAGETASIELGTGVVTAVARRPLTTAMAAATVDECSHGRLVLGLGAGPAGRGALDRLRSTVTSIRTLLEGGAVESPDGDSAHLTLQPPPGRRIPIWVAALGPRAMRLAGEIADGVLLNWCTPERVAFARERVGEGARAAGRDPRGVAIGVYVRACLGQAEADAMSALRRAVGDYARIPAYFRQFDAMGLGREAGVAASAAAAGSPDEVPSSLVRAVCLVGDSGAAGARFEAYREAGATLPIVYPVRCLDPLSSVLGTLFALAPSSVVSP